jgi:hypothetical protein
MKPGEISLKVHVDYEISLWQAIKLRIAGDAYKEVAKIIMNSLKRQEGIKL